MFCQINTLLLCRYPTEMVWTSTPNLIWMSRLMTPHTPHEGLRFISLKLWGFWGRIGTLPGTPKWLERAGKWGWFDFFFFNSGEGVYLECASSRVVWTSSWCSGREHQSFLIGFSSCGPDGEREEYGSLALNSETFKNI